MQKKKQATILPSHTIAYEAHLQARKHENS